MAKYKVTIDTEELISTVRAKTCLWNMSDANYYKRDYQRLAWIEVSDELNAHVMEVKKRWRNLRDTFTREMRKVDQTKTDDELAESSNWRYFNILMFLRGVVSAPRKTCKRMSQVSGEECDMELIDNGDDTNASSDCVSTEEFPEIGPVEEDPLSSIIKQSYKRSFKQEPIPIVLSPGPNISNSLSISKGRSTSYVPPISNGGKAVWGEDWKERAMDADAQFLMSLLPFLQDVPKKRKLLVRAKLTQVFMDEQNAER